MNYRTVTCTVRQVRPNSLMVETATRPGWKPISRALIHGGDEIDINTAWEGKEKTFRVMEWKAEELGLA